MWSLYLCFWCDFCLILQKPTYVHDKFVSVAKEGRLKKGARGTGDKTQQLAPESYTLPLYSFHNSLSFLPRCLTLKIPTG